MEVFLVYAFMDQDCKGRSHLAGIWSERDLARGWMESQPDRWSTTDNRKWDVTNTKFGHMYYERWTVTTEAPEDPLPKFIRRREQLIEGVFNRMSKEERAAMATRGFTLDIEPVDRSIESLGLSNRVQNLLIRNGFSSVGQLVGWRAVGLLNILVSAACLNEVKLKLKKVGLELTTPGW